MSFGRSDVNALPASLAAAIETLERDDATAIPFLTESARKELLAATRGLTFRKARPMVGEGERAVYQDFDICTGIPAENVLHALMRVTSETLAKALALIRPPPLERMLELNDLVVQRYAAGSVGISPHRDHLRYVGIVALVPLAGAGRFYVCSDRLGTNARDIPAHPGDLVLMRAPGLFGRTDRPYHALCDIGKERYGIGMRQDATKLKSPS